MSTYELTRAPIPAPKTDLVEDILRRALETSKDAFTKGASLRALGHMEVGARSYIKAIGALEAAAQLSLEILAQRRAS